MGPCIALGKPGGLFKCLVILPVPRVAGGQILEAAGANPVDILEDVAVVGVIHGVAVQSRDGLALPRDVGAFALILRDGGGGGSEGDTGGDNDSLHGDSFLPGLCPRVAVSVFVP